MLKVLRNQKTKRNIFIALAVVIIPPFVLWGTMTDNDESAMPNSAIARYNGRTISISDYLKSYKAAQHQLMLQLGDAYNQIGSRINIKGEAFDRILLLDYAKKERITVSDKEVVAWIGKQELFRDKNGFDDRIYKLFCEQVMRVQPRDFEEEVRQMLTLQKIGDAARATVPAPTDDELKKLDEKLFESDKEALKKRYTDQKVSEIVSARVDQMRKGLEINKDTFEKIFPSAAVPAQASTPASTEGPSTPS